jgi:hypothetical protein
MRRPQNDTVFDLLKDHSKLLVNQLNQHAELVPIEGQTYCLDDLRMQADVQKMIQNAVDDLRLKLNGRICSNLDVVRIPAQDFGGDLIQFVAKTPKFTE